MASVQPSGPVPARLLILGEAPGADEVEARVPFVGASGRELTRMLSEAGISRTDCRITNVTSERPPYNDISKWISWNKKSPEPGWKFLRGAWVHPNIATGLESLKGEINRVQPNLILALGNTALWALSGHTGIAKWRGSMLYEDLSPRRCKVIPTLHPAAILREWSLRAPAVADLRRASRYAGGDPYPDPGWRFIVRPSFTDCTNILGSLLGRLGSGERITLSIDLETRLGHIACIGLAWSLQEALCIPLMAVGRPAGYWGEVEERAILLLLHDLLTHPNVECIGQNLLYDCQYFHRHFGYTPRVVFDTMIGQHALFSSLPKSLGFLASLYCTYYVYWKDEGKDWREQGNEDLLWSYNCRDCVYTLEVYRSLCSTTERMRRQGVQSLQQLMFWPVLKAMKRGVLVDQKRRAALKEEVLAEKKAREDFLQEVLGFRLNPRSPKQMKALFYEDLRLPVQMTRASKGVPGHPTLDDKALAKLAQIEPIVKPIVNRIADIRTLDIFLSSFIEAPLDPDGRMRCSYNIGGSASGKSAPVTYRLSSSESAFGTGANLQTIPAKKSKSVGKAKARGLSLPNLRDMFIPDPGMCFFNADLDRADLQVVAWEAEDEELKAALKMGADIHLLNAFTLAGRGVPPLEELVESHPKYPDHKGPREHAREFAKVFCHASNYVGSARTIAGHIGRTVREVEAAQSIWFGAHPGIKRWHQRTQDQIERHRFVENRFGYRWYIFDRLDNLLPEAVAWVPQSTVSIYINRIWLEWEIHLGRRGLEVLLQVHDSLAGQFPKDLRPDLVPRMLELARVEVPYPDPLVIPLSLRLSEESWGACS